MYPDRFRICVAVEIGTLLPSLVWYLKLTLETIFTFSMYMRMFRVQSVSANPALHARER